MTSTAAKSYLRKFILDQSAIVLDESKDYLLESRLGPVANDAGVEGLDGLATRLAANSDPALASSVVEALTTNETYFFRDQHPFETLRTALFPALIAARSATRKLRVWCAAASTGQEPYTIAMVLADVLRGHPGWTAELVATDINQSVIDRAKEGVYRQFEVNRGLPAPMLVRYFDSSGANWQVKKELRDMVKYQNLNLLDRWPLEGTFDVVFLRNVLIYFSDDTKRDILGRTRRVLAPDGALFLGGAETTINLHDGYEPERSGRTTYYTAR